MKVSVVNSQRLVKIDPAPVRKAAACALATLGEEAAELSVYIVDDVEIKCLNYRYRAVDKPTDVLAFSMREGKILKGAGSILGDVVISAETALRQARARRRRLMDEMRLYLVHGILHLVGYNDTTADERSRMHKKQKELLGP